MKNIICNYFENMFDKCEEGALFIIPLILLPAIIAISFFGVNKINIVDIIIIPILLFIIMERVMLEMFYVYGKKPILSRILGYKCLGILAGINLVITYYLGLRVIMKLLYELIKLLTPTIFKYILLGIIFISFFSFLFYIYLYINQCCAKKILKERKKDLAKTEKLKSKRGVKKK